MGLLPIHLRKAFRNIVIYRNRVIATIILLTLGGTAYICSQITINSLEYSVDKALDSYNYDYEVIFSENVSGVINSIIKKANRISIYEKWKTIDASIMNSEMLRSDEIRFLIPPEKSMVYTPMISEGRWFNAGDMNKIVLSSHQIDGNHRFNTGDSINVMINGTSKTFEVIGFVREAGFRNNYIRVDQQAYDKAASVYRIKFDNSGSEQVKVNVKNLEDLIRSENLTILNSMSIKEFIKSFESNSMNLLMFFSNSALFMIILAGIGLASTMSIQVMGRTKEIGVLQSIGASRLQIFGMIVLETGTIGVLSFLLTICLTIPVSFLLNNILGVILFGVELYMMMPSEYFITFGFYIAVIICLASLAPAQIAAKTSVKEALVYE